jgi:hypothetical protein
VLFFVVIVISPTFFSCKSLESIGIIYDPVKTVYGQGQEFDSNGLVVFGTYSDKSREALRPNQVQISGYDKHKIGEQIILVTVEDKTTTFSVVVKPLLSITLLNQPAKVLYKQGENLDKNGLVIIGEWEDMGTETIPTNMATISDLNKSNFAEQTIMIAFEGKTVSFTVVVKPLLSITVTRQPSKVLYKKGENLDLRGLVVTGTWEEIGSDTVSITTGNISGYDNNAIGEQAITVMVESRTTTFTVEVKPLASIAITRMPTKTFYKQGEDISLTGLVVTGTWEDIGTDTISVSRNNISGYNRNIVGTQNITVTVDNNKTASFVVTVRPLSITVTSLPAKTVYRQGEALDLAGIVVTGRWQDIGTEILPVTSANISGYSSTTVGQQIITVTVDGAVTSFTVTVKALSSIEITRSPNKTVYDAGEALDVTGIQVTAKFTDLSTERITINTSNVSGYDRNKAGEQTLVVTVDNKTATFTVTVRALSSIEIIKAPNKTVYDVGEELDLTGMIIQGTYSDASKKTIALNLVQVSGYNNRQAGEQTLAATVNNKTATFTVTVKALSSIEIIKPPNKVDYKPGEELDLTGLVVQGTYSDASKKTIALNLVQVSGYNNSQGGEQTVTVTVENKVATFAITVAYTETELY